MRLVPVLAVAALGAAAMLLGVPAPWHAADAGTVFVGTGLALGLLSALSPGPRRREPVAQLGRRRVA